MKLWYSRRHSVHLIIWFSISYFFYGFSKIQNSLKFRFWKRKLQFWHSQLLHHFWCHVIDPWHVFRLETVPRSSISCFGLVKILNFFYFSLSFCVISVDDQILYRDWPRWMMEWLIMTRNRTTPIKFHSFCVFEIFAFDQSPILTHSHERFIYFLYTECKNSSYTPNEQYFIKN